MQLVECQIETGDEERLTELWLTPAPQRLSGRRMLTEETGGGGAGCGHACVGVAVPRWLRRLRVQVGTGQWDTNGTVFIILNAKDIINYEKIDSRLTNLNRWILFVFL